MLRLALEPECCWGKQGHYPGPVPTLSNFSPRAISWIKGGVERRKTVKRRGVGLHPAYPGCTFSMAAVGWFYDHFGASHEYDHTFIKAEILAHRLICFTEQISLLRLSTQQMSISSIRCLNVFQFSNIREQLPSEFQNKSYKNRDESTVNSGLVYQGGAILQSPYSNVFPDVFPARLHQNSLHGRNIFIL